MSAKKADLYGGLCKRCGLRPKRIRTRNLLFISMVLIVTTLWWWTNYEIHNAEQTGGSFIAHRLLVAAYENSGRHGVNVMFFSVFAFTVLVAAASVIGGYNQVKAIRKSLD